MLIYLSQRTLNPLDTALLRGYGVYEYLRTYQGVPFQLEAHLSRLERSCQMLQLPIPCERKLIAETILNNCLADSESSIKIFVGGGAASDDLVPDTEPVMFISIHPLVPFDQKYYEEGIKLITYCHERPLHLCKSSNYVAAIIATRLAKKEGALEPLFISPQGKILETARSNIFFVKDHEVITPRDGVLHGITRDVVMSLYPVTQREVDVAETWDEVFITSSNKEIMPVVQIDHRTIGQGKVGEVTKKISSLFSEKVNSKKTSQTLVSTGY
ncbi:MAG: aminotransferase class IV family protein [Simkaniaceae bacterium]|nr:aminotransferase class IV family protein [Simkaniaceae bacterium]